MKLKFFHFVFFELIFVNDLMGYDYKIKIINETSMILAQEDLEDDRTTHLRRVEHTTGTSACMASTHGLRGCGRGSMCCLEGSEMMDAARCFFLFPPKSQVPSIS